MPPSGADAQSSLLFLFSSLVGMRRCVGLGSFLGGDWIGVKGKLGLSKAGERCVSNYRGPIHTVCLLRTGSST